MIVEIIKHALMISSFVFVMMLVIEYLNVLSHGDWQNKIRRRPWTQYLLCSGLGATPGCLGAFAVVSLYIRRVVTFGSLVATMIATSGDEAFVLLTLCPEKALLVFGILFGLALISGLVVDRIGKPNSARLSMGPHATMELHPREPECNSFDAAQIVKQWQSCSPHRGILTFLLMIFLFGILSGEIGPPKWNWIRTTLALTSLLGLFITASVPDHFLEEHLWNHIVKKHILRIFLWTLGALLLCHFLTEQLHLEELIQHKRFILLCIACLVGLIPQSGPHLIFVTLYSKGLLPFSVLVASSIVQDGHGMLPLLAHSRRTFLGVKAINLAIGFGVGLIGYLMHW